MVWIGIFLCLGITSAQYEEIDKYELSVWGLSVYIDDCN